MRSPLLLTSLLLTACVGPDLSGLLLPDHSSSSTGAATGDASSSSDDGESTSIMTTTEGSGSAGMTTGTDSSGTSTTATTTEGPSTSTSTTTGDAPVCGDGVVAGDEECDDADIDAEDGCNQICKRDRLVFATSELFPSKLIGGLAGADGICRQLAAAADLDHAETFTAWLSDSNNDAIDRVFHGEGRYVRADGIVLADNLSTLVQGPLLAPIGADEHGLFVGDAVWTGTLPNGLRIPGSKHCLDWTTDDPFTEKGFFGSSMATGSWWTYADDPKVNPGVCSEQNRLYCFEGA